MGAAMIRSAIGGAALTLVTMLGCGTAGATECAADTGPNNPAFAAGRVCPGKPRPIAVRPAKSASGAVETRTPDGRRQIRSGDTTVTISGSVSAEVGGRVK